MAALPLPYYEVHPGAGPALLLVHGMLSSREQWRLNLEPLGAVATPVVLELFGHGRSPAPDDPAAYTPEAYVDAFERIRSAIGVERWVVCGQSLGAALTLRYALVHPKRLLGHVMTNSNSAFADAEWAADLRPGLERHAARLRAEADDPAAVTATLERMRVHPARARKLPAAVRDGLVRDAKLHSGRGVAHTELETVLASPLGPRFAENGVPTLLVVGSRERSFVETSARVRETMPLLQVATADAGHAVNAEAADAFNASVCRFIGELEIPAAFHLD